MARLKVVGSNPYTVTFEAEGGKEIAKRWRIEKAPDAGSLEVLVSPVAECMVTYQARLTTPQSAGTVIDPHDLEREIAQGLQLHLLAGALGSGAPLSVQVTASYEPRNPVDIGSVGTVSCTLTLYILGLQNNAPLIIEAPQTAPEKMD